MANALINSAPAVAGITDENERKTLVYDRIYPISRTLIGEKRADEMTAIAFGIIVDDTIHFLERYRKSRREGLAPPEAVRAAFRTVGHALWITTAIFTLGFLVFASSGFEVSWALGLMVAAPIVFALLTDFLLLPPLLMAIDRRKP